jgi:hypothetical protein
MGDIAILELIEEELQRSINKHGKLKNKFESYGVFLEELEEMMDELHDLLELRENMWENIKKDDDTNLALDIETMKNKSILLIKEAIQVATVLKKFAI